MPAEWLTRRCAILVAGRQRVEVVSTSSVAVPAWHFHDPESAIVPNGSPAATVSQAPIKSSH